jgi:peptidoglycan/LPS O-acetylase OafA/YrhL
MLFIRVVLACTALGTLGWSLHEISSVLDKIASTTSVGAVPYNAAVQKAIEVLIDQSKTWAQVTFVLLGLLAALWVAKSDEPQLALKLHFLPEIVIWVAVIGMLVAGLYCHNEYLNKISTALESGGVTSRSPVSIPNVFDSNYESLMSEQFRLLIFGSVASAVALFSVTHLAGGRNVQK